MNIFPTQTASVEPTDPYDTAAWLKFYEENPGHRRSVGAAGNNEGDDTGGDDDGAGDGNNDDGAGDGNNGDDTGDGDHKPSDKEAELLKDMMKHKDARKAAEDELNGLKKKFEGIDPDEYKKFVEEQREAKEAAKKAEEQRLLDAGEFDKVKEQMNEQHAAAIEALKAEDAKKDDIIAGLNKTIEELTVGSEFSGSEFIGKETIYTSTDARALYGSYFDVEDGKAVGYDKPRGAEGRAPIVDASGNPASFDVAMKRIIEARPDKDHLLVSDMKPGGKSGPSSKDLKQDKTPASARDKIASGLTDLMKGIDGDKGPDLGQ